jgi:glutamyl-tRNA reductase
VRIVVVGVNHSTAPTELRERVTIPAGETAAALTLLKPLVREGFIVSTCNRTEVYGVMGHATSGAEVLSRFLAERGGLDPATIRETCYVHVDVDAVRHALRVASGLDSMVLGEDQIQGQMKRALAIARDAGMLGATLERLGSSARACG